ncbi:LEAF RUST 10 DISEASE-RESISTANCE LOCUS RECEPTOR-LIKE PROTEIN KINASE-like 1.2 [Oryza brachyantha]|uniref:LEAF RUST 10 DISEASE-RESISTANCE LOCUS RECEPTOR-LIKE PROTEIN KINASE-like 1.2 n=1 Tax=Oryza brachyantha TaxID=4533 RepID=UPI001AD9785D|nr:LEAF RUST 10 DISEASE-RESISTANCE LOCUS RECEPTOR-LIKE PROTEIN KINASE-like 1.2 [Oryza brachyantha]XP_040376887.1 LEAF RUST 10 DISEASE-RESISTANCE LOCUS RECEPTOR-LIKE PROTEIN KINASE-like 1.2 [Oryza brachyantha]XP_040376890.1 LEAF RUST 10 DISEASE-RESISTANCE LOCUS RECEPTOR-LIKE PROTEIN KINASE-like 1.2 [Oryza brachyantha]XP_040376893.1 LEAF RUST 10 DISEASE-RESISTANCE LOCUS RECEPTOR-LIKE PROTEIN KINASE-like 1.2 [Oryza brachyantha]
MMHPAVLLLPLATLLHAATATGGGNETSGNASCVPARCGNLTIRYPFSLTGVQPLYCGYPVLDLTCDNGTAFLKKTFRDHLYRVDNIFYKNSSLVAAIETTFAGDSACSVPDFNVTSSLSPYPFIIGSTSKYLNFIYNCSVFEGVRNQQPCGNHTMGVYISDQWNSTPPSGVPGNCSSVSVPVRGYHHAGMEPVKLQYEQLIRDGFVLEWMNPLIGDQECESCRQMGGECRFPQLTFQCICPNGLPCSNSTSRPGKLNNGIKIAAGTAAAVVCIILLGSGSILINTHMKRKRSASLEGLIRGGSGVPLASLRKELSLAGLPSTHIFTYEELDEATDGFSDDRELGVGGFGTVYKGTLRDGSTVAVKRLYKNSYKSVEQFQNEVGILSRLRHPNLVALYGCTSPTNSRDLLLVYEFVPNGTLADHLHGAGVAARQALDWPTRLGIAVETASALEYLHTVEPQVVHRDVKTNNILLDERFHVKVADFGLSRLFPADATHVSTAPQGTPGYLDPMYHQCYQLTDKSDVYSFGVVLVELISSKPAVDMNRRGGDVNLASMAVHMIQSYEMEQLVDPQLGYVSDGETRRTVDLVAEVAFRCLQPEQDVRPPIGEVLGALREAQRMDKADYVKDDAGLAKKSRDGSPDCVMFQWISPSTTSNNSS